MEQKRCPTCKSEVQKSWALCPMDGTRLTLDTGKSSTTIQDNVMHKEDVNEALKLLRKRLNLPGKKSNEIPIIPETKKCPLCLKIYPACADVCAADSTVLEVIPCDSLIGQVLGGSYQVQTILGVGGSSQVYKARHVFLGRPVAIKVLHSSHAGNEEQVKRFLQESRAVSSLHHENIVNLYDFGLTDDGRPFLVMDLLEGINLSDLIRHNGPVDPTRAIKIFRQVANALNHAHRKGIVHRDVKPSNIVLEQNDDNEEVVKLVDFGLAKLMSWATLETFFHSMQGMVFGSPSYMSPEQCADKTIDVRSDIYSLGASLYEALSGKPVFVGESVAAVMVMQLHESPLPLLEVAPERNMPKELNDIVMKMLRKDPDQRHQSIDEFLQELDILGGSRKKRRTPALPPQRKERTSILVVDDEEVSLYACAMAISMQPDFEIIGVAINGELAVQKVQELKPDLVIMDLELPVIDGAEATRMIRDLRPETKILILSSHTDRAGVIRAFKNGAMGYVIKSLPGEQFFSSIRTITLGSFWIDDGLDEDIAAEARKLVFETFRKQSRNVVLSRTEVELLTFWLEDISDTDICTRLNIREDVLITQKQRLKTMLTAVNNS